MKKIYLLTFSLLALTQIKAQTLTLTQANSEASIGDTFGSITLDTASTPLPLSISGLNAQWNVMDVTNLGTTTINTYSTAASSTNSANYMGTNLVQSDGSVTTYYKSSSNMLELLGVDAGQFDLNYNTGNATLATYPMNYGYTNTDNTVGGAMNVPFASLNGTFNGTAKTEVDGAGTLNINSVSNFSNCLRVKTTQNLTFILSGFINGTIDQTSYNFYHYSSKFPIFSVTYSHIIAGPPLSIDQSQAQVNTLSNIDLVIGVKENVLNELSFKTYPNPTNNEVNLYFLLAQSDSYSVEISNTLGQLVKTLALNNLQPGMYNETINTADLSAGIYTIKVSGKKSVGTEKLIIQK